MWVSLRRSGHPVPAEARQEAACPFPGTFSKARVATELEAGGCLRQSWKHKTTVVISDTGAARFRWCHLCPEETGSGPGPQFPHLLSSFAELSLRPTEVDDQNCESSATPCIGLQVPKEGPVHGGRRGAARTLCGL